ncbi:MAG: nuclear transport factor 2 family protein [Acidobacteriota bacterium]|nr:nuclear transport factor 2 family protein [Acidobacteriota bacterium]
MKIKSIFLLASFVFLIGTNVFGQSSSVWAVDFVKTKSGRQADYLKFIEQNWAKTRAFMKEKGIVSNYQVLSLSSVQASEWDVLLMTEYKDAAAYEKREAVFNEFAEQRKTQPAPTSNKINPREISEIRFNRTFNEPISSETAKMMLAAQTIDAETAAARIPLENYLQGHATGNPEFMRKAFHTEGNLIFIREGKYSTRSFAEYINGMSGKPAADEDKRKRWIESVDVAGNAAIGKIILDYPNGRFVDYMSLLKINGEWKIVNKSFYFEPKPQTATPAK